MFIPILNFLDLSFIRFDNVDVRYIDFSKTNATINVRKVWNMDLSFSTFSDSNIVDWSDYTNVKLVGASMHENPATMINLDHAIISNETTKSL